MKNSKNSSLINSRYRVRLLKIKTLWILLENYSVDEEKFSPAHRAAGRPSFTHYCSAISRKLEGFNYETGFQGPRKFESRSNGFLSRNTLRIFYSSFTRLLPENKLLFSSSSQQMVQKRKSLQERKMIFIN